jgi:hypothetical protein
MKIAVCYYGRPGQYTDQFGNRKNVDLLELQDMLLSVLDCKEVDFFAHCWHSSANNNVFNGMDLASSIVESQIDFSPDVLKWSNDFLSRKNLFYIFRQERKEVDFSTFMFNYKSRVKSRWYSTLKSLELMNNYSKINKKKYDFVLLVRYDCVFKTKLNLKKLEANFIYLGSSSYYWRRRKNNFGKSSLINFIFISIVDFLRSDTSLFFSQPNFYTSITSLFSLNPVHLSDPFILASQENIMVFSEMYEECNKYLPSPHSSIYEHLVRLDMSKDIRFYLTQWEDYDLYRQLPQYPIS